MAGKRLSGGHDDLVGERWTDGACPAAPAAPAADRFRLNGREGERANCRQQGRKQKQEGSGDCDKIAGCGWCPRGVTCGGANRQQAG